MPEIPEPADSDSPNRSWGGRFSGPTDAFVQAFTASVGFDRRLYREDIAGSIAHARMLGKQGVLDAADVEAIVTGLEAIARDIEAGRFEWSVPLEDLHMNIEAALVARIGDAGKRLHTGRSRNDQVATDMRLYLRRACDDTEGALRQLQNGIIDLAEAHAETIMPGYTHLQAAQPVSLGHHLMAWFEMLERDRGRFADCRARLNVSPLGAAALAGTSYPIDRQATAAALEFAGVCANSLDAVSDRDFTIEFTSAASLLLCHLSRMAEELVLWTSQPFGFITMADAFCTGSSIMPQKKNPDVPELVRGKTGRVYGHLVGLLTLMKSQPLAYNKDNQEDKEPVFDTVDTVLDCLRAFGDLVPSIQADASRMREAANAGYITATDLADYLVRNGTPFRDAHEVVGKAVQCCVERGCELADLSLADLRQWSDNVDDDVFDLLGLDGALAARDHVGGTAPVQVRAAIARARTRLKSRAEPGVMEP